MLAEQPLVTPLAHDALSARLIARAGFRAFAIGVVDRAVIEVKLKVALAERRDPDTFIVGRTDAFGVLGLDEALRRAERFARLGVDGVFVAGLKSMADYERVGRELRGTRLSAAVFESAGMPWPTPAELGAIGFAHVSYPATLLFRITATMHDALATLWRQAGGLEPMTPDSTADVSRQVLDDALELNRWQAIESGPRASTPATGTS